MANAGARLDGPACERTFREVPWQEEVRFVRTRNGTRIGGSVPAALVAASGAVRGSDGVDKALDLVGADGEVRALR
jgi:hypothetical protein